MTAVDQLIEARTGNPVPGRVSTALSKSMPVAGNGPHRVRGRIFDV